MKYSLPSFYILQFVRLWHYWWQQDELHTLCHTIWPRNWKIKTFPSSFGHVNMHWCKHILLIHVVSAYLWVSPSLAASTTSLPWRWIGMPPLGSPSPQWSDCTWISKTADQYTCYNMTNCHNKPPFAYGESFEENDAWEKYIAGPCLPHSPITQLSPYLTRNPCCT